MKKEQSIWDVNLIELARDWLRQFVVLCQTALAFIAMAMPVLISSFIIWYLAGFPRLGL
jgi:hypothetical protein